jgi:CBS domain containing-hemolysin-like protein
MNRAKSSLFQSAALAAALLAASNAHASFLAGEMLDTVADYLALFVLIVMPIAAIVLFWLVHILPEKVAEQRHHPQKTAINTLCLLSLVFGGMLWPIAWLWAYARPVQFRMAYGTDKHEDYYREMAHKARSGEVARDEILRLKGELDDVAARRMLSAELMKVRQEFEAILAGAGQATAKGL